MCLYNNVVLLKIQVLCHPLFIEFHFAGYADSKRDIILMDFDSFDDLSQAFHSFSSKSQNC